MHRNINKSSKNELILRIFLFLFPALLITLMLPKGKISEYSNLKIGIIAPKRVVAPYDYEIIKSEDELSIDREKAKLKIIPIFNYNDTINYRLYSQYSKFFIDISSLSGKHKSKQAVLSKIQFNTFKNDSLIKEDSLKLIRENKQLDIDYEKIRKSIKQSEIIFLSKYKINYSDVRLDLIENKDLKSSVKKFLRSNKKKKILDINRQQIFNSDLAKIYIIKTNNKKKSKKSNLELLKKDKFIDLNEHKLSNTKLLLKYFKSEDSDSLIFWSKIIGIFSKPNLTFNKVMTENAVIKAQNGIPLAKGLVKKGEELVDKNQVISLTEYNKLISLDYKEKENIKKENSSDFFQFYKFKVIIGKFLHVLLPFSILFITLFYNRQSIFYDTRKLTLVMLVILFQTFIVFILSKFIPSFSEFLVLIPTSTLLIAIFFDTRVAFITNVIISLLISSIMGNSFDFLFISLIVGTVPIFTVSKIRDRFQLFIKPFVYIFLTYLIIAITSNFLTPFGDNILLINIAQGGVSALISPILAFGLISIIEIVFKLPTDIALLELSDMTRPLLKKLQIEAAGSYHHSIVVGNLAESATEAVGGNSLLSRVGAYYHDIGKTYKPNYFAENQKQKGENKHDKIHPSMSSLVIVNHVKEGVKLAKEYKLPQIIVDFIETHHGTSRIEYFYQKALELAKENGEKVDENIYRYPGPKPQTKETAIVMLADIIEARCRTIDTPSYDKYNVEINKIIKRKFEEDELDECNLKLNDLVKIKDAMLSVMMGMNHSRIKYPDQK